MIGDIAGELGWAFSGPTTMGLPPVGERDNIELVVHVGDGYDGGGFLVRA